MPHCRPCYQLINRTFKRKGLRCRNPQVSFASVQPLCRYSHFVWPSLTTSLRVGLVQTIDRHCLPNDPGDSRGMAISLETPYFYECYTVQSRWPIRLWVVSHSSVAISLFVQMFLDSWNKLRHNRHKPTLTHDQANSVTWERVRSQLCYLLHVSRSTN